MADKNPKQEAVMLLEELLQRSEVNERKVEYDKLANEIAVIQERLKKNHEKLIHQKLLFILKANEQQKTAQLREKLRKEFARQKESFMCRQCFDQRLKKNHEKLIHQKLLCILKAKEQQKTAQLREKLRKEFARHR